MRKSIILVAVLLISGCSEPLKEKWATDQCLRAELFKQCLSALPNGPSETKYNDWSEVVDSCADASYRQSIRRQESIKPECIA